MSFIGLLRTLEQITRPPRLGHDVDVEDRPCDTGDCWYDAHGHVCPHHCFDGAEQLAEREAEEDVAEPIRLDPCPKCGEQVRPWELPATHVCPEPPVIVRSFGMTDLLHWMTLTGTDVTVRCGHCLELVGDFKAFASHLLTCDPKSSASNHTGTGADPAPSPTIVQSAPPPTVDGEGPASVRDIQPSPEAGRSTSGFTAGYLAAVDLFEVKAQAAQQDLDLADRLPKDHAVDPTALRKSTEWVQETARYMRALAPTSPASPRPDDAVAEWIGEAVPVISKVLADHTAALVDGDPNIYCERQTGHRHRMFGDWQDWRRHVSPLIANALAPEPK